MLTKKILITLTILIFLNCKFNNEEEDVEKIFPENVKYDTFNEFYEVNEFYYFDDNTENKNHRRIIHYNKHNKIIYENHLLTSSETKEGTKIYYDYVDTLLVQTRTIYKNQDSSKIIFFYNGKNLKEKVKHYSFTKNFKKEVLIRFKNSSSSLISDDDYEELRTWKLVSEVFYKYDSLDRKIESFAPLKGYNNQNRYKWEYSKNGKLHKVKSLDNKRLIWTEIYEHFENGYSFIREWKDDKYQSEFKFYVITKNDKIIEKYTLEHDSIKINHMIYFYDKNGIVTKEILLSSDETMKNKITFAYEK